jgi:hypothetical protein
VTQTNESLARDLRLTASQIEALAREMGKPVEALPLSVVGLREAADRLEAMVSTKLVVPEEKDAWWGVDLDGTLVKYENWIGPDHVGEPIMIMVERIKRWLSKGRKVKIFTARVHGINRMVGDQVHPTYAVIEKFCLEVIGQVLPITCQKDYHMIELWDDRAVQVVPNVGTRVDLKDAPRFFIGTDDSAHYYLVQEANRAEWEKWEAFQSTDSTAWSIDECNYAWTVPDYARRIDGWSSLHFTDPKES